jgi:hypothetical protein
MLLEAAAQNLERARTCCPSRRSYIPSRITTSMHGAVRNAAAREPDNRSRVNVRAIGVVARRSKQRGITRSFGL